MNSNQKIKLVMDHHLGSFLSLFNHEFYSREKEICLAFGVADKLKVVGARAEGIHKFLLSDVQ